MRKKLVENDLLECVLGLGGGLFYNSPMKACVVICRTSKPEGRKGKVLFIDAIEEVYQERSQSFLSSEHQDKILKAYQAFEDSEEFVKVVGTDEILAQDGSLSIARYIEHHFREDDHEDIDLKAAWSEFENEGEAFWDDMGSLLSMLDSVLDKEVSNE